MPGVTRLSRQLARAFLPLPQAGPHVGWQAVAELAREQRELAAMIGLVGDEVAEQVDDVWGEVLPGGRRDGAAAGDAEADQGDDPATAARQRAQQCVRSHGAGIDRA